MERNFYLEGGGGIGTFLGGCSKSSNVPYFRKGGKITFHSSIPTRSGFIWRKSTVGQLTSDNTSVIISQRFTVFFVRSFTKWRNEF